MEFIETSEIPCTIVRGGTSRALFFLETDLPADVNSRNQVLLSAAGTQDETRVDGLVGQLSHNSKIAIVKISQLAGIDLEFQFGQVHLTKNMINYDGTCGNIISAVGVYALHKKLIKIPADLSELTVNVLDINTQTIAKITLPIKNSKYDCSQPFFIPGITSPSGKITIDYADTINQNQEIFPTNNKIDFITLESGQQVPVTITNILGLYVFINYNDFVNDSANLPIDDKHTEFMNRFKEIRGKSAVLAGILKSWQDVDELQPVVPRVVFMLENHDTSALNIKMLSSNKVHHSIAGSAAISLAATVKIKDTIPFTLFDNELTTVNIKHPSGSIELTADYVHDQFKKLSIERNARVIMDGMVYVANP